MKIYLVSSLRPYRQLLTVHVFIIQRRRGVKVSIIKVKRGVNYLSDHRNCVCH